MNRRGFLSMLGLGSAAVAALPIEELIDRLAFARSPTSSIYLPRSERLTVTETWDRYRDCYTLQVQRPGGSFVGIRTARFAYEESKDPRGDALRWLKLWHAKDWPELANAA